MLSCTATKGDFIIVRDVKSVLNDEIILILLFVD